MLIFGIAIWPFFENTVTHHASPAFFWCSHCPWREKASQPSAQRPALPHRHLAGAWKKDAFLSEFHGAPRHVQEFSWCDSLGFLFLCHLGRICRGWGTAVCQCGALALIRDKCWRLRLYKIIPPFSFSHFLLKNSVILPSGRILS